MTTGIRPLLAHIYESHRITFPCFVQPKLNGIRALYQNGYFQSRDLLPFPKGLLDHLAKPLLQTFDPTIILDGELYVHGWPLQRINAAVTPVRQQPTEDTLKVEYHVFDRVDYSITFEERIGRVHDILIPADCSVIRPVTTVRPSSQQEADELYARFVSLGYEGMMYRLGDCPYTLPKEPVSSRLGLNHEALVRNGRRFLSDKNNRCWHLLKRKDWQDDDFTIRAVLEGEGKLRGMLGALVCDTPTGDRFHVGSGLTDLEREKYWDHPELILGHKVKVKYLVLSQDGIPLNPTILAIL